LPRDRLIIIAPDPFITPGYEYLTTSLIASMMQYWDKMDYPFSGREQYNRDIPQAWCFCAGLMGTGLDELSLSYQEAAAARAGVVFFYRGG